jgi:hypothetical protein
MFEIFLGFRGIAEPAIASASGCRSRAGGGRQS